MHGSEGEIKTLCDSPNVERQYDHTNIWVIHIRVEGRKVWGFTEVPCLPHEERSPMSFYVQAPNVRYEGVVAGPRGVGQAQEG